VYIFKDVKSNTKTITKKIKINGDRFIDKIIEEIRNKDITWEIIKKKKISINI
jgi:hypothetical protein